MCLVLFWLFVNFLRQCGQEKDLGNEKDKELGEALGSWIVVSITGAGLGTLGLYSEDVGKRLWADGLSIRIEEVNIGSYAAKGSKNEPRSVTADEGSRSSSISSAVQGFV